MIYLFFGPDEFSRSEALAEMRAALPAEVADLNYSSLDGRKLKPDQLAAACEAMPFLADHRVVVVHDALKHSRAGKERDELRAYLEKVPAECRLVFVERDDVDKRSSIFNYIKKSGELRDFQPRSGKDLLRWIDGRLKRINSRIEPAAARRLVDYVGNDSRALVNELAKLASYAGNGNNITVAMVDLLVQDRQEQNLFAFIDDLGMRRRSAALRGLRQLFADGQAPTYILFMLARQVRILIGVRELAARRLPPDEIAGQLGQKPFVVRKAMDQARNFEAAELARLHDRLLEFDHASKTGRIAADVALELLVLEMCGERAPR